ncbi:MAG: ABC transporter ATP-binding protein [Lachnospiraceae bacterium]|nr:ABC transporter ATP-binding protein [Lachnospiraceae bacterium]MDY5742454.1 ABC transporter ATP-binding protein [Lachnospiraceae bacterium]
MIELEQLEVSYGDKKALNLQKRLQIKNGEKVGLIGSNGAGKSTLIKAILGLVPYQGKLSCELTPQQIAIHMQQNEYSSLVSVHSVMTAILGCRPEQHELAAELIRFFDFESCLKKRFKNLSGGQKQRLTMILVMCQESPLTIFDEVTSGLDYDTRTRLIQLLHDWFRDRDTTLIVVSHYYEELENLVDRLLLLEQGELIAFGNMTELFAQYCGKTAIIMEKTEAAAELCRGYRQLETTPGKLAVRCDDTVTEQRLTTALCQANIDYQRTHRDIELMVTNAKAAHQKGEVV